jgi:Helix-hairpin-helix motif
MLTAQQEDAAVGELLENFFRDNEGASESDAQLWLEQLEQFRQNPLDLNRAERSDLVSLHLLNELQVEKFVRYRDEMGPFLNIYELQAVEDWDLDDIRRILPYIKIGNGGLDERGRRLREGFLHGENELLLRWGRPVDINYPIMP